MAREKDSNFKGNMKQRAGTSETAKRRKLKKKKKVKKSATNR
jgi:hypothetical protein